MKAMVAETYGGPEVMEWRDVAAPVAGEGEVVVAVRATTLQALDWHFLRGEPRVMRLVSGLRRPERTINGVDLAGVVTAVGAGVHDLEPGDEVVGWTEGGALAEFVAVPRSQLVTKPGAASFDEAATIGVAAFTALQMVRDHAAVTAGDRVIVVGASSGVGHFAVQLAKAAGAHVTGVCSTRNVAMVRSLGADEVLDRTATDWTESTRPYDVILQVAGSVPFRRARRALAPDGRYVLVGFNDDGKWLGPAWNFGKMKLRGRLDRRVRAFEADENAADLAVLRDLLAEGTLKPHIDRRFELVDAAEAMAYVEQGRASGKVVVTI